VRFAFLDSRLRENDRSHLGKGRAEGQSPSASFVFPLSQRGIEGDSFSQIKRVRLSAQFGPFLSSLVL
jgi:hypothetical protein